jgi:hypothetical protein
MGIVSGRIFRPKTFVHLTFYRKRRNISIRAVVKNWKLVEDRADYPYSSAGYYDYGRRLVIEITDINKWLVSTPSPRTAKGA